MQINVVEREQRLMDVSVNHVIDIPQAEITADQLLRI